MFPQKLEKLVECTVFLQKSPTIPPLFFLSKKQQNWLKTKAMLPWGMWSSSQNVFLDELRLNFLKFPLLHNLFTCFQMLFKVVNECHLRSFIDDVHFGYITKLRKTWLPRYFLQWYYIFHQYKLYPNLVKIVNSISLNNTSVCQYWKCVWCL